MSRSGAWEQIEEEARDAFGGEGRFPLPAYSEFMPAPHVVIKPYAPSRAARACTLGAGSADALDVTEYEWAHELAPGLPRVAERVLTELDRLLRGKPHGLSSALVRENPAWPEGLAATAAARRAGGEPLVIALGLALSRTQDDKGNVRWTLFGASHDGAGAAFWRSFADGDRDGFGAFLAFAGDEPPALAGVRVIAAPDDVPAFARELLLPDGAALGGDVHTVVTFRPFAALPAAVRDAYAAGRLRLCPHPASLIFFEHPGYRRLGETLPRAGQIPLLHLFPRSEDGYRLRIPQSGWLDEHAAAGARSSGGHRLVHGVARSHRWQRVARTPPAGPAPETFEDRVSVALFSVDADDLGLYGKPMARNAQIWSEDYQLILDGPRATRVELQRADATVDRGGRFGYRFLYPPMRAGARELYWHLPLVARLPAGGGATPELFGPRRLDGYVHAEADGRPPLALGVRFLERPGHLEAAALFDRDPGRRLYQTENNIRNLLAFHEQLAGPLSPSLAWALTHAARPETLDSWLRTLADVASDPAGAARAVATIRQAIELGVGGRPGVEPPAPASAEAEDAAADLTFADTRTRAFEERLWQTIAGLCEGEYRAKETADSILVNHGRKGGAVAHAAGRAAPAGRRDLDRLGDHLHDRYRALIEAHGMAGRARVVDHPFRWETDFPFRWSDGWLRNQTGEACERNVVLMIPGRDRGQAVIMADHYDTAYMEDAYEKERGGDGLRAAAAGADDNHSATAALLAAAEVLLPRARAGELARDVWLVHLTGEEFPADCLGARALAQALVERRLRFVSEEGTIVDVSGVRVAGAFVLDMIAHNNPRDRDVFQIAPGEGDAAARLARHAHAANELWNRQSAAWNQAPDRRGLARAARSTHGADVPPPFAHLALRGEIRPEWDPRSSLYNTDGQIFSDVGVPVVLFMESYDINRTGYHDTEDTMKNIDLDYAAALTAIAIETVARAATAQGV